LLLLPDVNNNQLSACVCRPRKEYLKKTYLRKFVKFASAHLAGAKSGKSVGAMSNTVATGAEEINN